ncbi:MAG: SurA N-terminal domain-containing protein [Pseudomonadota bacterium]
MLEFIRERAQGWVAWVIVIFLIATFALWGIQEYVSPDASVNVAVVDGKEIPATQFQQTYQQQRARLQAMLGANFNPAMLDEKSMKNDVLEGMIDREVLVLNAAQSGMQVGDTRVGTYIRAIPELQNDGQFDKERYNNLLRSQGLSVKGFEQAIRGDLLLQQLRQGVMDTAFVTQPEVDALIRLREQRRDLGYLIVPVAQYLAEVQVDEQAIKRYYEDNREKFRTPEQVSVDYIELSVANLAGGEQITEEVLRQRYEEHKSEFSVPEERQARHILIQASSDAPPAQIDAARTKIQEILARVRKGESFADLARHYSEDPGSAQNGGDLGFFSRGAMDKAFEDASFALTEGQVSEPVRSAFGFHIIKLESVRGGQSKPFEEVRAQLAQEIKRQRAEEQYFALAEQLYNLTFENPDNLTVAAETLRLPIHSSGLFTREQGSGIASHPKVRAAAFGDDVLLRGNNSEAVELAADHEVVLRIKEHKPEAVRPLETVREEISQLLRIETAKKKTEEVGRALLSRLEKGEDIVSAATSLNLAWVRPGLVGRAAADVNPEIIGEAFRLQRPLPGKPLFGGKSLPSGDFTVLAVYEVKDGDPAGVDSASKQSTVETLVRGRAESEFQGYVKALKAKTDIKRYPDKM